MRHRSPGKPDPLRTGAEGRAHKLRRRFQSATPRRFRRRAPWRLRRTVGRALSVLLMLGVFVSLGLAHRHVPQLFAGSRIAPDGVYYPSCASARRAGAAPIRRGEPGYRPKLDADDDGIACEPLSAAR